jgi:hypothetical protein
MSTHTRSLYDKDSTDLNITNSTKVLKYKLDPVYSERCDPCFPLTMGVLSKQGVSYDKSKNIIDMETDLFNINRPLSKNPQSQYHSKCPNNCAMKINKCDKCKNTLYHFSECSFQNENTRLDNPSINLREVKINRFEPFSLCLNPQNIEHIERPSSFWINNRILNKDNYVPRFSKPTDQTVFLPKPIFGECNEYKTTCVYPIKPLNNNQKILRLV